MDTRKTSNSASSDYASETVTRPGIDLKVTTLKDIYKYEPPEYIIEPFVVKGWSHLLTAPAGDGKSVFSLLVCKSVLTGEPLFGKYPVNTKGPVLIIDEENPRSLLRDRAEKMRLDEDLRLYFLHFQEVRIDNDKCFDSLMATIETINPVLIVFDSLIRVHRQDENESKSMAPVMANLRKVANRGIATWIVHHQGHQRGGQRKSKSRGSTDILAGVDIEYSLSKNGNILTLESGKTRVEKFGPVKLNFVVTDSTIEIVHRGAESESLIKEVVKILLIRDSLTVKEIQEEMKDRKIKVAVNKLRTLLKASDGRELMGEKQKRGKSRCGVYSVNGVSLKPSSCVDG